ncbi:MAG: TolC family protein [Acidobacteria bacterium]|nr:TolC family protein [Acidobacteriota bacterium]
MSCKTTILAGAFLFGAVTSGVAQSPGAGEKLTLKRAVALALQNSREMALARVQSNVAEKSAEANRALFRPNLYAGSGLGYTRGYPQTPGGGPPSVFNVNYVQTVLNGPVLGELRAAEQRAEAQRLAVDGVRDAVIVRTASFYLELAKVRHSLELQRRGRESAQKIVDVTRERWSAGVELPVEVTRAQLAAARIEQRIVNLEGREETLEGQLRSLLGLPSDQRVEAVAEELPAIPDYPTQKLVELALSENTFLKQAEAERRAREQRVKGERNGYWPTLDVVGQYGLYARFNNFDQFFRRFRRHSLNIGLDVRIPIFSARTTGAVALAQADLGAAEIATRAKRNELEIEVRRQSRRTREMELAREVARLELQLAQENLRVLQAQFQEGRTSLRDLEKARLEESDKWLAFLDADFERQRAQLEVLQSTGQLAKVFQ